MNQIGGLLIHGWAVVDRYLGTQVGYLITYSANQAPAYTIALPRRGDLVSNFISLWWTTTETANLLKRPQIWIYPYLSYSNPAFIDPYLAL